MKNYLVKFFKKADPDSHKPDEYLGSIEVSDVGTDRFLTLHAKAYRQAPSKYFYADKLKTELIRDYGGG